MRVTWLGHACHLVEQGGVRVLSDPWLVDPAFDGLVEHDPPLVFGPADLPRLDALTITHGHLDHFHAPTLAAMPDKSIPVYLPPIRLTRLDEGLRLLGFHDLRPLADWQGATLGSRDGHGSLRITATPSLGVLDECAWHYASEDGSFWNGADAPQPDVVIEEILNRLGRADLVAVSHNSFDQPALLGLESFKEADHGPLGALATTRTLGAKAALPAASGMRWCGEHAEAITRKVIRRSRAGFLALLAREEPAVAGLDLEPGDAWSVHGGIERGALRGRGPEQVRCRNDYVHVVVASGARWTGASRPDTETTFLVDLPRLTARVPEASLHLGQTVCFHIRGEDPGVFTVDFGAPGSAPTRGDAGAPFAIEVADEDWKDLFERRIPWQTLLMSDRLRVRRVRRGAAPDGLHFAYALQAVFP